MYVILKVTTFNEKEYRGTVMVFNTTFNNMSAISLAISFIGGGNRSTSRKPPTRDKLLTNFIT